jgi:signal transduction histidine kinase
MPILIIALASFSLARFLPRHRGLLGMAVIFGALVATQQITVAPPPDLSGVMFLLAILTPPYAFGWVMRRLDESHSAQTRLLMQRQDADRREAVAAERARIARELHDVLAHSVSAMVVQAEAASDLIPRAPDRAVAALREVTAAGRAALTETRRLLRLLRDSDNELGLTAELGLDRLDDLVERFRRSSLRVDLVVDGSLEALPTGVNLAGYRIAQETLTNALKYAGDQTVSFKISRTPTTLQITTANRADVKAGPSRDDQTLSGLGLVGIHERVSGLGGNLSHGLRTDGVFEITATLPLTPDPA